MIRLLLTRAIYAVLLGNNAFLCNKLLKEGRKGTNLKNRLRGGLTASTCYTTLKLVNVRRVMNYGRDVRMPISQCA